MQLGDPKLQARCCPGESYYSQMLSSLASEKGIWGQIFTKSQNKVQDPATLLKIIENIEAGLESFRKL